MECMQIDIWCMLDWIWLCHKMTEMHFPGMGCSTSECIKWDAVTDRDGVCENQNPLQGLTLEGRTWWNGDLCTTSRTENGCQQGCERMKIFGKLLVTPRNRTGASAVGGRDHNHVFVYLYGWGCSEVELQSKWKKWKRKSKKNDVGGTWETQWKWNRIWEAWMVRKSPVMRWKIYRAAARCDGREAGRVDSNARRLKSSSSLRVDAIQAIDIFIRGCYL